MRIYICKHQKTLTDNVLYEYVNGLTPLGNVDDFLVSLTSAEVVNGWLFAGSGSRSDLI